MLFPSLLTKFAHCMAWTEELCTKHIIQSPQQVKTAKTLPTAAIVCHSSFDQDRCSMPPGPVATGLSIGCGSGSGPSFGSDSKGPAAQPAQTVTWLRPQRDPNLNQPRYPTRPTRIDSRFVLQLRKYAAFHSMYRKHRGSRNLATRFQLVACQLLPCVHNAESTRMKPKNIWNEIDSLVPGAWAQQQIEGADPSGLLSQWDPSLSRHAVAPTSGSAHTTLTRMQDVCSPVTCQIRVVSKGASSRQSCTQQELVTRQKDTLLLFAAVSYRTRLCCLRRCSRRCWCRKLKTNTANAVSRAYLLLFTSRILADVSVTYTHAWCLAQRMWCETDTSATPIETRRTPHPAWTLSFDWHSDATPDRRTKRETAWVIIVFRAGRSIFQPRSMTRESPEAKQTSSVLCTARVSFTQHARNLTRGARIFFSHFNLFQDKFWAKTMRWVSSWSLHRFCHVVRLWCSVGPRNFVRQASVMFGSRGPPWVGPCVLTRWTSMPRPVLLWSKDQTRPPVFCRASATKVRVSVCPSDCPYTPQFPWHSEEGGVTQVCLKKKTSVNPPTTSGQQKFWVLGL